MSYDATAEPNEFFADTRAEAIEKAVRFFGSEEAELNIQELSDVFGLGARVAVVAVPKSAPKRPPGGDRDRALLLGGLRRRTLPLPHVHHAGGQGRLCLVPPARV